MLKSGIVIACVVLLASSALAYTWSPPAGAGTGAPGESTCADCHGNLNTGPGSVGITVGAGREGIVQVTVDVSDVGMQKWGFMITALDADDVAVGNFVVTDAVRTQELTGGGREYIAHTGNGTDPGVFDVAPGWTMDWDPPVSYRAPITFYVCGVAADNAGGPSGDNVYTATYEHSTSPVENVAWTAIKALYR